MYPTTANAFLPPGCDPAARAARVATALPVVVSVHLPKTAGTSFGAALRRAYGEGYLEDYGDLPMQHAPWRRQWRALRAAIRGTTAFPDPVRCVHGHFLATKYRLLARRQRVCYITWLRDPVERLASHYHFWRRDYAGDDPAQPLRNRMLEEDWSFERFALGGEMRDVYTRYLWGFDPRRFDFIGITEHYERDLERLSRRHVACGFPVEAALVNPERGHHGYDLPRALRRRIEGHHAKDLALYRWALGQATI